MTLSSEVPDGATIFLDTNPILYVLENGPLASRFEPLFRDLDEGRIQAIVSPISVAEVMAGPLSHGKEALAERYHQLLCGSVGWTVRALDADLASLAARMRTRYRLKLPDAIQLATALHENCFALVSHDRGFGAVREIPVLGL
ncbi:MAG TPA: PIN domain-containing protein [Myxococcales bacterium]|mgnify:CR=1 FL=1|jgi:predicted nucleic acid-binding protein|nr:PIN domain-containing protein [Myxococcales bacterium]